MIYSKGQEIIIHCMRTVIRVRDTLDEVLVYTSRDSDHGSDKLLFSSLKMLHKETDAKTMSSTSRLLRSMDMTDSCFFFECTNIFGETETSGIRSFLTLRVLVEEFRSVHFLNDDGSEIKLISFLSLLSDKYIMISMIRRLSIFAHEWKETDTRMMDFLQPILGISALT